VWYTDATHPQENRKAGVLSGIYYLGWGNFFMNITNR